VHQGNFRDWIGNQIVTPVKSSRASMMLRHFMYRDPTTYLRISLGYGGAAGYADYLTPPYSPLWQQRFSNVDTMLRLMSEKARAASVPMVLLVGPTEAQAALINSPPRDGVDPQAFETEVARIASKYGISTIDPLPEFAGVSNPMDMFFTVNSHLSPRGQRPIADAVNKALISSKLPAFAGCSSQ
jgi:hypothetical protein